MEHFPGMYKFVGLSLRTSNRTQNKEGERAQVIHHFLGFREEVVLMDSSSLPSKLQFL